MPSISGMIMSVITTSTGRARQTLSASRPLGTASATSNSSPQGWNTRRSHFRTITSSSTIKRRSIYHHSSKGISNQTRAPPPGAPPV